MRNIDIFYDQNIAVRVFHLFIETMHSIVRETDRQLYKAAGLSGSKISVLMVLSAKGEPVAAVELAEQTNTRPHNITTLVDRMKADGLVTTSRSELDRRLVLVGLTDKGQSVFKQAMPTALEFVAKLTASMSEQELVMAEKLLNKVKQNINENLSDTSIP
jgi:DNA-binding MarR family transcriptional regulator